MSKLFDAEPLRTPGGSVGCARDETLSGGRGAASREYAILPRAWGGTASAPALASLPAGRQRNKTSPT